MIAAVDPALEIRLVSYLEAYGEDFEDCRRRVPDLGRLRQTIGFSPRIRPGPDHRGDHRLETRHLTPPALRKIWWGQWEQAAVRRRHCGACPHAYGSHDHAAARHLEGQGKHRLLDRSGGHLGRRRPGVGRPSLGALLVGVAGRRRRRAAGRHPFRARSALRPRRPARPPPAARRRRRTAPGWTARSPT